MELLFLDDGGVLNDNSLRASEYRRLLGEFMPSRLGGSAQDWAEANRAVFPALWKNLQSRIESFANHEAFQHEYELYWIRGMCQQAGVTVPADDLACQIAREALTYVARRANTAIPGAAESVSKLHDAGFILHMASGTPSWELEGILTRMGIRTMFTALYGPDLINHVKHGPEFYRRIFKDAGVKPQHALVIESCADACEWARSLGAKAVRIGETAGDLEKGDEASTLADLVPQLIHGIL